MVDSQKTTYNRFGRFFSVWEDPGHPAYLDSMAVPNTSGITNGATPW
ncbi:MAG: hypothetical protein R3B47_12645 [Bacteroidia bacterium]